MITEKLGKWDKSDLSSEQFFLRFTKLNDLLL